LFSVLAIPALSPISSLIATLLISIHGQRVIALQPMDIANVVQNQPIPYLTPRAWVNARLFWSTGGKATMHKRGTIFIRAWH
jgi:hypothetical protein